MSGKYPGGIVTAGAPAGYSVAFNGSTDYLTSTSNTSVSFGNSTYTIEMWVYQNARNANGAYLVGGVGTQMIQVNITSTGTVNANLSGGASYATTTATVPLSTWTHLAFVRTSTASNGLQIYINGVSSATGTDGTNYASTNTLNIGTTNGSTTYVLNGYISNLRVLKGTALYSATFTPPTQLFNISNTSLLTCNSPAIIDQSTTPSTLTSVGSAAVSTFTPFTGYSATPPNPNTQSNTSGVWSVSEAEYWMAQNKWPMPYPRQSLRFNSADSARLTRTNSVTGNQKTMTFSFWMKRTKLGTNQQLFSTISGSGAVPRSGIGFTTSDTLDVSFNQTGSAWIDLITTQVFRDVSSWYHLVIAIDTTQATSSNRVKLYVNGSQVTAFGTAQYPTQNADLPLNWSTYTQYLGSYIDGTQYVDLYMSDFTFVDGLALDSSYFGQTDSSTGAWIPQNYTGNYGTNGYKLTFQDNSNTTATTLGKDWSGKGNNWTPANFSVAAGTGNDSLTDSPWNFGVDNGLGGEVRGNYCTLNPLNKGANATITNGNLDLTGYNAGTAVTIAPDSGKYYWEMVLVDPYVSAGGSYYGAHGIASPNWASSASSVTDTSYTGFYAVTDAAASPGGGLYQQGVRVTTSLVWATNDIIGLAYDAGANTLSVYRNGTIVGSVMTVAATSKTFNAYMNGTVGDPGSASFNFGQRPFAYPAPSGYKALCTTNLPTPAIGATSTTLANTYFDATLYTGNGTSQSITNAGGFSPDWVWVKSRSNAYSHYTADILRGVNSILATNSTNPEVTVASSITAFNSNGFSVGTEASTNGNGATFVAWQWDAGSSTVTNTSGSISSQVRANTTAGFSVVTMTYSSVAGTVGHGLGVAPKMIIVKRRDSAGSWYVAHSGLTNMSGYYIVLDSTAAQGAANWGGSPTSTVFYMSNNIFASGNYVAYCFAAVAGYSAFGSYTGNGSTDGPFVYCGFRPRWILIKRTDVAQSWGLYDTARNTYNVVNSVLYPNLSNAEGTWPSGALDILSNGFKLRVADAELNASAGTYIYAAFAETPFNYSRAR